MNQFIQSRPRRSFLTDALIYGIGGVIGQVVSVLLLPLYTRYLPPSQYGILDLIEQTSTIINICLMTGGVQQAAFAFYLQARDRQEQAQVPATIGVFLLVAFLMASGVIVLSAPLIAPLLKIDDPYLFVFGVVAVMSQLALAIPLALMQARVESARFVIVTLSLMITRVALILLFLVAWGFGIWGIYLATFLNATIFGFMLTFAELKRHSFLPDWKKAREIVRFSLPFVPTGVLFFLLQSSDRFFLLGAGGTGLVGVYALCKRIASGVGLLSVMPLFKVWTARMYAVFEEDNAAEAAGQMLTRMYWAYCFLGTGLCVFQREVLALLVDDTWHIPQFIIPMLVLAQGVFFCATFFECVFYVRRKTAAKPLVALAGTAATVSLYALLIPRFSLEGAAIATVLGYFLFAIVTWAVAERIGHVRYEPGKLAALTLASAVCVILAMSLPWSIAGFALKCVLIGAWLGFCWFFRIIDPAELVHLTNSGRATAANSPLDSAAVSPPAGSGTDAI